MLHNIIPCSIFRSSSFGGSNDDQESIHLPSAETQSNGLLYEIDDVPQWYLSLFLGMQVRFSTWLL